MCATSLLPGSCRWGSPAKAYVHVTDCWGEHTSKAGVHSPHSILPCPLPLHTAGAQPGARLWKSLEAQSPCDCTTGLPPLSPAPHTNSQTLLTSSGAASRRTTCAL